eukprot:4098121-Heterocapsa_arctica.AAC.1
MTNGNRRPERTSPAGLRKSGTKPWSSRSPTATMARLTSLTMNVRSTFSPYHVVQLTLRVPYIFKAAPAP